jgi:hypothetical protein
MRPADLLLPCAIHAGSLGVCRPGFDGGSRGTEASRLATTCMVSTKGATMADFRADSV